MRTIALEEHFATSAFLDGPGHLLRTQAEAARGHPQVAGQLANLMDSLLDLGDGRLTAMDDAGIDVQVLSLTSPGVEQLPAAEARALARESNDELADAVRAHPDRFAALATIPTADPDSAAEELDRVVGEYGFLGAIINGHNQGRYLDDEFFWPILERVEALTVPLYLHPTTPPEAVVERLYTGNFPTPVSTLLATAAWGWHIDTATHVLRLILSGAFDRFPGLQVIVGHLGEGLPFMLPRLDRALPSAATGLDRPLASYLRENLHYTISGFNWTSAFLDLLGQVGADRIMFSTDYPYSSMAEARTFLDRIPISPADRERIAYGNAAQLLRLARV